MNLPDHYRVGYTCRDPKADRCQRLDLTDDAAAGDCLIRKLQAPGIAVMGQGDAVAAFIDGPAIDKAVVRRLRADQAAALIHGRDPEPGRPQALRNLSSGPVDRTCREIDEHLARG